MDGDREVKAYSQTCPSCGKAIVFLKFGKYVSQSIKESVLGQTIYSAKRVWEETEIMAYPKGTSRPPVPKEVPKEVSEDYVEACLVLSESAKASAALSRRSLQLILRSKAGVKSSNLADEINEILSSGKLPSHISGAIDGVRAIGNFAAHPEKSQTTGQIVDVEAGEAEWLLDTIEALFDYYYVQPAVLKAKQDSLNKKLKDIGKPPIK